MGCRGAWPRFGRWVGRVAPGVMAILMVALAPAGAWAGPLPGLAPGGAGGLSAFPVRAAYGMPDPFGLVPPGLVGRAPRFAAANDDGLTPPPVVDPKPVETRPVGPAGERFAGQEEVLASVPVIAQAGTAKWDDAYDTLAGVIKALDAQLKSLGLTRAGDVFVVYSESSDDDFKYEVQIPFSGVTTKKPAGGMTLAASYGGKVIRFTHSGAFTDMDNTYEMIANYLDEKNITAGDLYIEQYRTDLVTSPPDALKIDILVPVR